MDQFIKKLGLFLAIFIAYNTFMYLVNTMIVEQNQPDLSGKKTLIIGDSHPKFALNPELFKSAVNVAQTSEPYCATYWKLKTILQKNTPDTVILGFSYHNLSAVDDMKFKDPFYANKMFHRLYSIEEFEKLDNVEVDLKSFYKTKYENMCLYPNFKHDKYLGSYNNMDHTDLSGYESIISRHYFYQNEEVGISATSLQFLDSIRTLCEKKDIELIMISTPLHPAYFERVPEIFIQKYQEVKQQMQNNGVLVLDYGQSDYEQDYFLDPDHLNKSGAQRFTMLVKTRLSHTPEDKHLVNKIFTSGN